uniref:Uncharacterized protein n=1 Tax=Romanomermis culicivorax TaxID=13658 RepID=A0A915IWM6_ROMCU
IFRWFYVCTKKRQFIIVTEKENLSSQNKERAVNRRRVIFFLQQWIDTAGLSFFQDPANVSFVEEIYSTSINEPKFPTCSNILESIMLQREKAMRLLTRSPIVVLDKNFVKDLPEPMAPVAPTDIVKITIF